MAAHRVSAHTIHRRVNFHEADPAGLVHFSNYYRYMEEAEYALWRAAGLRVQPDDQYTFPRVAASFDFHSPLRFDDEFDVRLHITAIGRTSLRYACRIMRGNVPIATGTMTIVCVTLQTMRATSWPADWLERIEVAGE